MELKPNMIVHIKEDDEEKAIIVAKAAEVGTHTVADAYGLDWHSMRHGKSTTLNMLILRSKQLSSFNPQMVKR